jgi:hypothetical protein
MSGWEFRRISWSGHKVEFGLSNNVTVWHNDDYSGKKMSADNLDEMLNQLGAEGWEMINVYGMLDHAPKSWRNDTHDIHHAWFRRERK